MPTFTVRVVDQPFIRQFCPAGEINESVVAAHRAESQQSQHPQRHPGVKRYYYLCSKDPKISLISIGRPIETWKSAVMAQVGDQRIIGEFSGNELYIGLSGTRITFRPLEWLRAPAEKDYATASALFQELELPLMEVEVVVHANCLQDPAVAALLREYHCPCAQLSPQLYRVLLRGIESREQVASSEVLSHLPPSEQPRFVQAQQTGVTVWRFSLSNGKQLLYLQALHAPWSFFCTMRQ